MKVFTGFTVVLIPYAVFREKDRKAVSYIYCETLLEIPDSQL